MSEPIGRPSRSAVPRILAALLACFALSGIVAGRVIAYPRWDPADTLAITFEELGGHPVIATTPWTPLQEIPNLALYSDGRQLGIPAGFAVAFPLRPGSSFEIESVSSGDAPRIVVGSARPLGPGERFDNVGDTPATITASVLTDPTTPLTENGRLTLGPWNAGQVWRVDQQELAGLSAACVPAGKTAPLTVSRTQDTLTIQYGHCTTSRPGNGAALLGILAGTDSVAVTMGKPWPSRWTLPEGAVPPALKVVLLNALLLVSAFGAGLAVVMAGLFAVASLFIPYESALLTVLLIPVALVMLTRRLPSRWRWTALVPAIAALAGLVMLLDHGPGPGTGAMSLAGTAPAPRCVAAGYSTVTGFGLRFGTERLGQWLQNSCGGCTGSTVEIAKTGESFQFMTDTVCGPEFPAKARPDILFLGGTNDDMLWAVRAGLSWSRWRFLIATGRYAFYAERADRPDRFVDPIAWKSNADQASLAILDRQVATIQRGVGCVTRAGGRFHFFQDFLVSDLPRGRSLGRERMVAARREATHEAGGQFDDLLVVLRDEASVSWFNDSIHLSSIGHRKVASLLCKTREEEQRLSEAPTRVSEIP